jgi:NhaP-type Na+/H+ or K+/H+ antiporter
MRDLSDTSDLRALARVILDREDLEQASMTSSQPAFDPYPVRRRLAKGLRLGSLLGVALGLASSGAGTADTFRQPAWLAFFVLFTLAGTVLGAAVGAATGLVARSTQRRRLDRELADLVDLVEHADLAVDQEGKQS